MTHITKDDALNIAGQCRATASSPLAKTIAVDGGSALLCELLLDAAKTIEALAAQHAHISPKQLLALAQEANLGLDKVIEVFRMAAQPAVPEGWKLVPAVPTNEWVNNLAKMQTGNLEEVPFLEIHQCIAELLAAAPEKGNTP